MKRLLALALAALCAPSAACAQDWLPPQQLVMKSIDAQPDVKAAMHRVDQATAQARARAVGNYEIETSVIAQQRRADEPGGVVRYQEWEAQLMRGFRWPGKVALDKQIGDAGILAAELRLDDARHQVARRLLEQWTGWLRAAARAEQAAAQIESLKRERQALARRVQLGDAARKDLDLLDVDIAQTEALGLAVAGELSSARAALANDFPTLPVPEHLPNLAAPPDLPETAAHWIARIVQRSHEIEALEADATQADALARRVRADRLPDPNLGLRLMQDRGGQEKALGLVFSMPIGGRHRAALADAENAHAAALHGDAAVMRRDIQREAEFVVRHAAQLRAEWQARQRALDASAAASTRIRRGWELGELSLSEWLLAERVHRQIALDEAAARVDAEQARLRVLVDSHDLWHDE